MMGLLNACSVKKNTLGNRIYHNLSAHYNGYWNGKESYNEGLKVLNSSLKDNYAQILPVFNYGTLQDAQSISSYMERAIQKAGVVIQKHSMRFQRKEYNRWVDDAYLLIGKSYFYSGEFISARRTFEFMMNEFKASPSAYEAMLWLIRTYNRSGQFEKSEPLLKQFQDLVDYENVPLGLQREFPMLYSDYFIRQGKLAQSADYLIRAIEINNNKQFVTRLKFILAQVYQNENKFDEASELFTEIIHRNPDYEMAFNAKINRAKSYNSGSGNYEEIMRSLKDLLSDQKNLEYRDQIYYVMAEIELKQGNTEMGVRYLKNSVAVSDQNNFQKVASCITLADLLFHQKYYADASLYYDTALQVLPSSDPDYGALYTRTNVLVKLVGYMEQIQLQDSLQALALLPETERIAIVDQIVINEKEREQEILREQSQSQNPGVIRQQNTYMQSNQASGSWYFYNPSTLSFGYNEFVAKWGRRPLEDNWRLSQKQAVAIEYSQEVAISGEEPGIRNEAQDSENSVKDRNYYLKDIPINREQLAASNRMIIEALYQSGILFKESLDDKQLAIDQFERLVDRFPDNEYLLQSYYNLYRLYAHSNNEKAEDYKQRLLQQFPNSDYAKVLLNPMYFKEMSTQNSEIENLYLDTYEAYQNEQYFVCIRLSEQAIDQFTDSILIPKFEYLRALSLGRMDSPENFIFNLQQIIQKYPHSEVITLAEKQIHFLQSSNTLADTETSKVLEGMAPDFGKYQYNPDTSHLYILIINAERVNLDAVKLRLSDFNIKRSSSNLLNITSFDVGNSGSWLAVMGFENKLQAADYLLEMTLDEYVLKMLNPEEYEQFVIGVDNYSILLQDQDVEAYIKFYYKYYQTTK